MRVGARHAGRARDRMRCAVLRAGLRWGAVVGEHYYDRPTWQNNAGMGVVSNRTLSRGEATSCGQPTIKKI